MRARDALPFPFAFDGLKEGPLEGFLAAMYRLFRGYLGI